MSGAKADELQGVSLKEVTFLEQIKKSNTSTIFKTVVRGKLCFMKVYHTVVREYYHDLEREYDPFTRESQAYRRLKKYGLCESQLVPNFYGVIETIDPNFCGVIEGTHRKEETKILEDFLDDEQPPRAVLLEFISDLHLIDISTYSKSRADELRAIIHMIHAAMVLHHDVYPRNMVVRASTGQAMWVDFDTAIVFREDEVLTERQQEWFGMELRLVDEFLADLVLDCKDGKYSRTLPWYPDEYSLRAWALEDAERRKASEKPLPYPVDHRPNLKASE